MLKRQKVRSEKSRSPSGWQSQTSDHKLFQEQKARQSWSLFNQIKEKRKKKKRQKGEKDAAKILVASIFAVMCGVRSQGVFVSGTKPARERWEPWVSSSVSSSNNRDISHELVPG